MQARYHVACRVTIGNLLVLRTHFTLAEHWGVDVLPSIRESARIVIVGGGVIGLSVAYHLARLGLDDVLLIERNRLTSGTS